MKADPPSTTFVALADPTRRARRSPQDFKGLSDLDKDC